MTLHECYSALELPHGASWEDVRKSHKLLATVWHPDRFTTSPKLRDQAEEKLKTINEAYATLKAHFDRGGQAEGAATSAGPDPADEVYVDRQVRYHGGDERLRAVGFVKRPAMVRVGPEGITLGTTAGQDFEEVVHYPAETIRGLDVNLDALRTPGTEFTQLHTSPNCDMRNDAARLNVSDPEGLRRGFHPTFSFRSDYYRQVFQKRVAERLCPCSWQESRRLALERRAAEEKRKQEEQKRRADEEARRWREEQARKRDEEKRRAEALAKQREEMRRQHPVRYWVVTAGPTVATLACVVALPVLLGWIGSPRVVPTPATERPPSSHKSDDAVRVSP